MKRLSLLGIGLMLSACQMVGPDYHLPQKAAFNRSDLQGPLRADADPAQAVLDSQWTAEYKEL